MPNRLAGSTSPYLLQHKDNPVDWWPWGDEAFAEAERRDVPVLVSIGYAACHWCHVMAHESFENPDVATLVNDSVVAVKVDREERPDVDAVYMEATQALTGQGGWPMTVFTTPTGEPFFCGTYFPPSPRHGMPSFPQLVTSVAQTWRERREDVLAAGQRIVTALAERSAVPPAGSHPPGPAELDAAVRNLAAGFDEVNGGFGDAPKFPPSMALEQLLRHHARTGDGQALRLVESTCEAMARGGMYDQLGGGFARYSVDARWVVPHFEKMLYDNALLVRVYTHLWRATGSELARRVALDTADWMVRDLRTAEGGFASALDADTDGVEGLTYVWTPAQLGEVLGEDDGRWASALLTVTADGTFEHGASTLQLRTDPDDGARWESVRERLLAARDRRPQPARDDKVVTGWNGLAVAALAEAGALLDRAELVEAATATADLLSAVHVVDGRLRRVSRDGVVGEHPGVLEDYADLAEGLLALGAVTGDAARLRLAGELLEVVLTRFADDQGGFYDTADDRADTRLASMRRPQDPTDNATPSGQAAAAGALLTYGAYTGSTRHREAAERALAVYAPLAAGHARFAGWGLAVAEALADGPREVAVVGRADDPATARLHRVALLGTAPGAAVVVGDPDGPAGGVPLLVDRPLRDGRPTAYVCRHFRCDAPTTDPADLAATLGARPSALGERPWR
jgi:uncharacterized protein